MVGMSTSMLRETTENGIRDLITRNGRVEERGIVLDGVLANGQRNTKVLSPKRYGEGFYRGGIDTQNIFDATYLKIEKCLHLL